MCFTVLVADGFIERCCIGVCTVWHPLYGNYYCVLCEMMTYHDRQLVPQPWNHVCRQLTHNILGPNIS